ncbi:MAG: hypothetical protein K9G64_05885 [Bacteroidia bacterium]|jgi:hypothetical protein|nr:hypothetical protein [Bacteroidia bacterium]
MKNEIENIGDDFLKNLGNKGGFDVPEKYFEQSKASVLSKINADSNFAISNNEGGFTVPNSYFETNKVQILSKINNKETSKSYLFTFANWQFVSGMAAIFIAIISLYIFLNINKNNTFSANLNKVSEAEMIEYLANNDVKIEWINELNPEIKTVLSKDENNKEIEQYLLEHADEQALLDEL